MASATNHKSLETHKGTRIDGNLAQNKDSPMPNPQPPPSPPATVTDTDSGSPSSPLSPPANFAPEAISTQALADHPDSGQGGDGPTLRLDMNMEETGGANASTGANNNPQSPITSPISSPPYWTARSSQDHPSGHGRNVSSASVDSLVAAGLGITLQDNENSSTDDRGSACWAKSVEVTDYVTVNGSATNIGAFVVWNIRVETLSGSFMVIRKRYSEFDDLRWRLMRTFPGFEAAVPELPPKSLISKFRPRFLEQRRAGLQYFLTCIMLNPEFSGSPVLKEFLFS
ncbi:PX domain-containing protein [Xylaria bambusicola]|uniref:PX domain-containing protein n=1 Tax=Xylaria bambusicola TaxID=326684 RepID=UPI00200849C8|nr:PX domain-containing protein [Xylaria bambusicola]KAI0509119.1 PX domain-containing protein [Xylaria bambusicola]